MKGGENMKKKKEKLFSKTFIYLVLLIALVAGFFLMVNYTTNQKLSMNSEAKENKCQAFKRAHYNDCQEVKKKSKDTRDFVACTPSSGKTDNKYIYCQAQDIEKGNDCRQAGGTDWFKMSAEKLAQSYNKKYIVKVTDVSNSVGQYYKDKNGFPQKRCLRVEKMIKRPSCSDEKGNWYPGTDCYSLSNRNYIYESVETPSKNLSDYQKGKVCCNKFRNENMTNSK